MFYSSTQRNCIFDEKKRSCRPSYGWLKADPAATLLLYCLAASERSPAKVKVECLNRIPRHLVETMLGVLLLVCAAVAAAVDFKSISNDLRDSARSILRAAPSLGSGAASMRDMHYAIKVLRALNSSGYQSLCSSHCDSITSAFKQASRGLDLYYTYNVGQHCECNVNFNTKSFIVIDEDLEVMNAICKNGNDVDIF